MEFPSATTKYHHTPTPVMDPKRPELSAQGKVVLVTGGGAGIGITMVKSFAEAGAKDIVISGRRLNLLEETAKEIRTSFPNTQIHVHQSDVSNESDVESLFAKAHQCAGPINILVSNAGYLSTPGPIATTETTEWWKSFEINIKGTYLLGKAFVNQSPAPKSPGTFVSLNSGIAHTGSTLGPHSAYAGSKLAAASVVEFLQHENPDWKFFSLSPGIVATDMNKKSGAPPGSAGDSPELSAHFIVWLASPESDFLKGRFLWANWDVDELKALSSKIETDPSLFKIKLGGWPAFRSLK